MYDKEEIHQLLIVIAGRASFLPNWVPIVDAVEGVDVFLLSFDEPIDPQVCNGPRVTCIFGEGASYANGRNLLAKSIYETEVAKGITYKYWMFGDQDIITTECDSCKGSGCGPTCIRDFVGQYLRSNESSPPVVAYAYPGSCMYPQWQSQEVWAVDAMFNGFHRQAVPFLLPYSTRLEQESWWESQIFLFYLWSACMGPNHPTVIASWCHYSLTDNQHSSYPRWKLVELQPTRRQYLDEEVGAHGIDLLTLDFPYKDDERITPETTIAFSGGSEDITWYSQNGKRWYESYEARLCTDRLHERFMSVMGA